MTNTNTRDAGAELLAVARAAALEVGDLVREGFGAVGRVSFKRDFHDVVTEYDKRSEEVIADILLSEVPGSTVCGEEGGILAGDAHPTVESAITWYVDPIDGTGNFARGLPFCCVSIGAVQAGELVAGIVYDPLRREEFTAADGRAFCNGEPMASRAAETDADSVLVTGFPKPRAWAPDGRPDAERFTEMVRRFRSVRRIGSSALTLAYVAAGRIDVALGVGTSPWDVAAGSLLVENAGGTYIPLRFDGNDAAAWDVDCQLAFGRGFVLEQSCLADLIGR
ncbi:MAG TPA: inositol monophosphatase family protein [Nocardioidaceae bacterium]|nr:inositol monophosphatase family protein [Nocardioidaceae bacterium]